MSFYKEIFMESIKDRAGKISSARLSSFAVLGLILVGSVVFTGIEIGNFYTQYQLGLTYTIPFEHITLFGLILGHHLGLLGIKSKSDANQIKPVEVQQSQSQVQQGQGQGQSDAIDESLMDSDGTH